MCTLWNLRSLFRRITLDPDQCSPQYVAHLAVTNSVEAEPIYKFYWKYNKPSYSEVVFKVESRIRPLLSHLSRTHEYDDRFADNRQLWTDSGGEMSTRFFLSGNSASNRARLKQDLKFTSFNLVRTI